MAPSAAAGTTGLERVLLIFLMKINRSSFSEQNLHQQTIDPTINRSKTLKLPKTSKNATTTARRTNRTQNLHRNLRSQHEPTASPPKLPIHRSNKSSNERRKTSIHRTKAQTNSEERQTTNQNFERTVKNADTPNENSNNRWKTPKMVAPAHNHTKITETSRTHVVDGK